MADPIVSKELRQLFREEVREDPDATLGSFQVHLSELCESAPSDSLTAQERSLTELTELLEVHNEHTPLADLLSRSAPGV